MINFFLRKLYEYLPNSWVRYIGSINFIKPFRDFIIRPNGNVRIDSEKIYWGRVSFQFFAPIRVLTKAKKSGIESTLLRFMIIIVESSENKHPVLLDIGANYGFLSIVLCKYFSQARVFAFEPHPKIYESIKLSLHSNKIQNLCIENMAVGNVDAETEINLFGTSSNILNRDAGEYTKHKVQQIKGDSYLHNNNLRVDLIKIDVDGYELEVIEGLRQSIISYRPVIIVETNNNPKIFESIEALNYHILDMGLRSISNEIPPNVFCLPSEYQDDKIFEIRSRLLNV